MGKSQAKNRKSKRQSPRSAPPSASVSPGLYGTLNVARNADDEIIRRSYLTLIKQFPPETHAEEFQSIREAYEILSNPLSRRQYDRERFYGKSWEQLREKTQRLIFEDRLQDAAHTLVQMCDIKPSSEDYLQLAHIYSQLGLNTKSQQAADKAMALVDTDEERVKLLMSRIMSQNDADYQLSELFSLLSDYPEAARNVLGPTIFHLLYMMGDKKDAMSYYRTQLSRKKIPTPGDIDIYIQWITALAGEHDINAVKKLLTTRIKPAFQRLAKTGDTRDLQQHLQDLITDFETHDAYVAAQVVELLLSLDPPNQLEWRKKRRNFMAQATLDSETLHLVMDYNIPTILLERFFEGIRDRYPQIGEFLALRLDGASSDIRHGMQYIITHYPHVFREFETKWRSACESLGFTIRVTRNDSSVPVAQNQLFD